MVNDFAIKIVTIRDKMIKEIIDINVETGDVCGIPSISIKDLIEYLDNQIKHYEKLSKRSQLFFGKSFPEEKFKLIMGQNIATTVILEKMKDGLNLLKNK